MTELKQESNLRGASDTEIERSRIDGQPISKLFEWLSALQDRVSGSRWHVECDDDDADDDDDDDDDLKLQCVPETGPTSLTSYSCLCTASGGEPPYIFTISKGKLPAGLTGTQNSLTYLISGTPTNAGNYAAYTVQVRDTKLQSQDHQFKAGTISQTAAPSDAAAASVAGFVKLGAPESSFSPEEIQYSQYALLNQDADTGRTPPSDRNPFTGKLSSQQITACDKHIQSWLSMSDGELWENLYTTFEHPAGSLSVYQQYYLVRLCSQARSRSAADRKIISAYNEQWKPASQLALVAQLSKLPSIAEMCNYMSTYRPHTLSRTPPFSAGAELVTVAITQKWPSLGL